MANTQNTLFGRKVPMTDPPQLTANERLLSGVVGAVFLLMAILQLISFGDFRDNLEIMGLASPTVWGVVIILAELWAAADFFKLRLSYAFRAGSIICAVGVAGFWFIQNLQVVANGNAEIVENSNLFGRFLAQQPGWWTILETTALFGVSLYFVSISQRNLIKKSRR